jgi:F-type H+-transporting ATPase subunit b
MEFLKDLGLDKYLVLAQIVNFTILFLLLKAVFFKPLKKVLDERKEKIMKGIQDADAAKVLIEKTEKEKDGIIRTARQEVQVMIEDAKKAASDIKDKIIADAKKESEQMVLEAQSLAEAEMRKMEKEVKTMSMDISRKILGNVIPVLFTGAEKDAILKKAVKTLEEKGIHE